jgi:hypothetical protein
MTLDVTTPDPPDLEEINPNEYQDAEVAGDTDYKRDEIESLLRQGAWEDAFEEWTDTTDLDQNGFEIMIDLEMIQQFDFFWDSFADRVGYHAPGIPEDWQEQNYHPNLNSWGTVSGINATLSELGQIVCDVLKEDYIDWETEYEAPDDLPEFEPNN